MFNSFIDIFILTDDCWKNRDWVHEVWFGSLEQRLRQGLSTEKFLEDFTIYFLIVTGATVSSIFKNSFFRFFFPWYLREKPAFDNLCPPAAANRTKDFYPASNHKRPAQYIGIETLLAPSSDSHSTLRVFPNQPVGRDLLNEYCNAVGVVVQQPIGIKSFPQAANHKRPAQ